MRNCLNTKQCSPYINIWHIEYIEYLFLIYYKVDDSRDSKVLHNRITFPYLINYDIYSRKKTLNKSPLQNDKLYAEVILLFKKFISKMTSEKDHII